MENLVRNAPPSLFKPKFSIAPSATSQNRILMEVLMKQPLPAQVAQPRMWLLRNVRNIRIISKKNKPHLSCVFLFSCVVPEPIYGHCMGSIGTDLFNWHFRAQGWQSSQRIRWWKTAARTIRENKPVPTHTMAINRLANHIARRNTQIKVRLAYFL